MASSAALAVEPARTRFGFGEEPKLRRHLDDVDSHTVHIDLHSPADIRLDDAGRLRRGGFRFTTLALAQLCQKLCPGLTKLAFTVSGMDRDPDEPPELFSVALACRVINDLADRRFDLLVGRQMVRDTRAGLVEGLTGAGYMFLSNKDFYERVRDAVDGSGYRCDFHDAELVGRRLTLYYRHATPLAKHDGWDEGEPDVFHEGYDLTNSETGECAVRTAPVLVMSNRDATALRGPKRRRLIHSGSQFNRNLISALGRTLSDRDVLKGVPARLAKLSGRTLGFARGASEDAHRHRVSRFVGVLGQHKLSRPVAERAMRVALYQDSRHRNLPAFLANGLERRSRYDLLVALMCEARQVGPGLRDVVERAAYDLLSDRLPVPEE